MFSLMLCSPSMADSYTFVTDRQGLFQSPMFMIIVLIGAVFAIGVMSDR
ncbi:MAG: hypothetical protein ACI8RZ_006071 [Myxococcota bacterium]|jgi:hypothetical protein